MARYVMLEFDDDQMAVAFVKAVTDGGVIYPEPVEVEEGKRETAFKPLLARVRGLWFKPTKFCECGVEKNTPGAFVKGSKYGVFVHRVCKKPAKGSSQWPKNLLDPKIAFPPKAWLHTTEPLEGNVVADNGQPIKEAFGVSQIEPTPKAELDRVKANISQL